MEKEYRSSKLLTLLSRWYDWLFCEENINKVERAVIAFALVGFFLHLFVIFLARTGLLDGYIFGELSTNYLKAIYTPFSIILFYEVLTLVVILPQSVTIFIGKQYEILTLIVIRSFFHDIADYDLNKPDIYTFDFLKEIGIDLVGALLLFFFTILYYWIFAQTKKPIRGSQSSKSVRFIQTKKGAAVMLSVLLLVLSFVSLISWVAEVYHACVQPGLEMPNPDVVFYKDFFNVMIFVDVFLLILSLIYSGTYDLIFRNAGFVISTILVRIALTAEKPFNIYFALTAVLFGTILMGLFVFYNKKVAPEQIKTVDDRE
jgi:hypothetical protein